MRKLSIQLLYLVVFLLIFFAKPTTTQAHPLSSTYIDISLNQGEILAKAYVPLPWLIEYTDNDSPQQLQIILSEKREKITDYILNNLKFKSGEAECKSIPTEFNLTYLPDGPYVTQFFTVDCILSPTYLTINYNLYFESQANHPAFVIVTHADSQKESYILTQDNPNQVIGLKNPNTWIQFKEFIQLGIHHIFLGYDHILFILLLLLPTVLAKRGTKKILLIITSFTIAHSLTLGLASLKIITLPTQLTESVIALSIVVAALFNLYKPHKLDSWLIAFSFGLIHGFGFANILAAYELPTNRLVKGLLGFNIGVELGQLVVVAAIMPILYILSHKQWGLLIFKKLSIVSHRESYSRWIVPGVSSMAALIALYWFIERAFQITLF